MRRVINCAGLPFRRGWSIVAPALRGPPHVSRALLRVFLARVSLSPLCIVRRKRPFVFVFAATLILLHPPIYYHLGERESLS